MRVKLRHLNRFFLNRIGLNIEKIEKSASLVGLLRRMRSENLKFDLIFDVGAYNGKWSAEVRKFFPSSKFLLFEPNTCHNSSIEALGFTPNNLLLGSNSGTTVEFYSAGNTGDSFFKEKNPVYNTIPPLKMQLTSLEDFIDDNQLTPPDFLKLDTQGSELDILKGIGPYLDDVTLILVELPISGMNIGAPSLSDVSNFLESNNFVPYHLTEVHYLIDILVQVDIAFLNRRKFMEIHEHDDIYHRA